MEKRKSWVVVLLGILLALKIFVSCEYFSAVRLDTLDALFAFFLMPFDLSLTIVYLSYAYWNKFCTRITFFITIGAYLVYLFACVSFFIPVLGIGKFLNIFGIADFIAYNMPVILSVVLLCDYLLHIIWFVQGKCTIPSHKRMERANLRLWYFGAFVILCGKLVLSCLIFVFQYDEIIGWLMKLLFMPIDVVYTGIYLVYSYINGISSKTVVYVTAIIYGVYSILNIIAMFGVHIVEEFESYIIYIPLIMLVILLSDAVVYGFRRLRKREQ